MTTPADLTGPLSGSSQPTGMADKDETKFPGGGQYLVALTIERADVVAGVLVVVATVGAVLDGKVVNLLIGAAMVGCICAIAQRCIFRSYLSGQRSRNRRAADVVDLQDRRGRLTAVPDRPRQDGRF